MRRRFAAVLLLFFAVLDIAALAQSRTYRPPYKPPYRPQPRYNGNANGGWSGQGRKISRPIPPVRFNPSTRQPIPTRPPVIRRKAVTGTAGTPKTARQRAQQVPRGKSLGAASSHEKLPPFHMPPASSPQVLQARTSTATKLTQLRSSRAALMSGSALGSSASAPVGLQKTPVSSSVNSQPTIHEGKQGKHIPEHNNYQAGKSVLTANPTELAKFAGTGQAVDNKFPRGSPGFRERVDFKTVIGNYVTPSGDSIPTTKGIIHYAKDGIHIVPSAPE